MKSTPISTASVLVTFSPFIGPNELLLATERTKQLGVVTFDVKHPNLLDSRHHLVGLLLQKLQNKHCHRGFEYLRASIQQNFAIVKLRTTLGSIQPKCVSCSERKAETLNPRLVFGYSSLTNTGLNYFGPPYVSVRRSTEKRREFLFTWLTTRAVHFEVFPAKDTKNCVKGLESFVSRRNVPSVIWSDKGKNYIASEKEMLNNILKWSQQVLTESLFKNSRKWKFTTLSAPHHRGVWQRLVRIFKQFFGRFLELKDDRWIFEDYSMSSWKNWNARTLVPAGDDAIDLDVWTPKHC